jgi:hypothetical protein
MNTSIKLGFGEVGRNIVETGSDSVLLNIHEPSIGEGDVAEEPLNLEWEMVST